LNGHIYHGILIRDINLNTRNLKTDKGRIKPVSALCLSPESYEVNLQAGLLAHPVPAAFPFHILCNSGGGCQNNYRIYSCGYSSRFPVNLPVYGSRDSLFTQTWMVQAWAPEIV